MLVVAAVVVVVVDVVVVGLLPRDRTLPALGPFSARPHPGHGTGDEGNLKQANETSNQGFDPHPKPSTQKTKTSALDPQKLITPDSGSRRAS